MSMLLRVPNMSKTNSATTGCHHVFTHADNWAGQNKTDFWFAAWILMSGFYD